MKHQDRKIRAILFDLDDTLIDWSGQSQPWANFHRERSDQLHCFLQQQGYRLPQPESFAELIHNFNVQVWADAKKTWQGACFVDALTQSFQFLGLEDVDLNAALQAYGWQPFPGVELFPETLEVLENLHQQSYQLGLVTNSFLPMWMRDIELEHYQLIPYFPARITSGDTRYMKPHPAIFWRMLGMLGRMPEESVFVGDRLENDILGANEVGMISVWRPRPDQAGETVDVQPDYIIDDLNQLLQILKELES